MAKMRINQQKCKGCLLCINVCPQKLIEKDDKINNKGYTPVKSIYTKQNCSGCCLCAIICPECCIEIER
ncbi:MAG: 4Fe-4S binding protein [Candidatus Omnitrophica bacterium]|nr:4Fe-4S binding protein [Candidatus Omnitrophota bacterium]